MTAAARISSAGLSSWTSARLRGVSVDSVRGRDSRRSGRRSAPSGSCCTRSTSNDTCSPARSPSAPHRRVATCGAPSQPAPGDLEQLPQGARQARDPASGGCALAEGQRRSPQQALRPAPHWRAEEGPRRTLAPDRALHTRDPRRALGDAVRWGLLERNPAKFADPPAQDGLKPGGHIRTWSPEQVRSFLDSVAGHRLSAAWLTLITTGMRRGELLGCAGKTSTSTQRGPLFARPT